jgi:hypothetical protein
MVMQNFGDFLPDQPVFGNPGLVVADGCFPIATGYAPFGSFAAASPALPGRCFGGGAYQAGGETYVFAATATDIYGFSSDNGFTSLKSGLTSSQEVGVQFLPYARLMLATNGADPIQKYDPASPGALAALGGTPPTARFLAEVRGFVVAGYCAGSALRVAWSDFGLPESWAVSDASLAGTYDMPSGGDITGVVGGEYGLIFQAKRVVRMSYTADDSVWQWDELSANLGCTAPQSLATFNNRTFFLSDKGFMTTDGTSVTPIGDEKINRTFVTAMNRGAFQAMSAAIDPVKSLYIVSLPSADPAPRLFVYNYALDRWSTVTVTTTRILPLLVTGTSIDDLDAIYGSLDAIPFSLDSAAARGGYPLLLAFDTTNRMGGFSGAPIAATFTDGLREPIPGRRARLKAVRPITDAAEATVTIAGSNGFAAPLQRTAYATRTAAGVYRTREAWNLMQLSLSIPAGTPWSYAQGYDADLAEGGRA